MNSIMIERLSKKNLNKREPSSWLKNLVLGDRYKHSIVISNKKRGIERYK